MRACIDLKPKKSISISISITPMKESSKILDKWEMSFPVSSWQGHNSHCGTGKGKGGIVIKSKGGLVPIIFIFIRMGLLIGVMQGVYNILDLNG